MHQSSRSGLQDSHSDLRRPMMMGNALALADYHPLLTSPLQSPAVCCRQWVIVDQLGTECNGHLSFGDGSQDSPI
jgi:hypothetical protein